MAVLTAAMLLSVSASADASLIASLMQTGRSGVSLKPGREGLCDWLNALTDAAHQIQIAMNGDASSLAINTAPPQNRLPLLNVEGHRIEGALVRMVVEPPVRPHLTNLPPPIA